MKQIIYLSILAAFVMLAVPSHEGASQPRKEENRPKTDSSNHLKSVRDSSLNVELEKQAQVAGRLSKEIDKPVKVKIVKAEVSKQQAPASVVVIADSIVYEPKVEKYKGIYIADLDKDPQYAAMKAPDTVFIYVVDTIRIQNKSWWKKLFRKVK